jgi:hypothetical protein
VDGVCAISCDNAATELLCAGVGDDDNTGAARFSKCVRTTTATTTATAT